MPILKLVSEREAEPRVREAFARVKEHYGGYVPDLYRLFANDPAYLESVSRHIFTVMEPRNIDAKTKEIIAFAISAVNGCDFCINAHNLALRRMGLGDAELAEILGVVALWEEVTRFNIGARLQWPAPRPATEAAA
ncbi:MAG: carboxymuconolactone decarboxylase family protein [Chloroflexi bacterium]|nr:carboxymuconolactone decarboxylase family protein [Chloroflexota bacterium]